MTLRQRLLTAALAVPGAFVRQPSSPWLPIAFYGPLALAGVLWNLLGEGQPAWTWAVLPAAGLLFWTLLEYVLHSQLFHPKGSVSFGWLSDSHLSHHDEPDDPGRVVARLSFSLPVAVLLFGALSLALWSPRRAALLMAGVIPGYLSYEIIHFAIHQVSWARRLLRPLASHHLHHHYADPTRCYGVSSPLWDWILRTGRRPAGRVTARGATATPTS
jgi:sterol desaturase/sphingolipid hydroxylase (fatty acid hydroxylase superfamily)